MTFNSPTKTMKRKISWLVINAAEIFLICMFIFNGSHWAGNLIKFWIILCFISLVLCAISSKAEEKLRKEGRSVPKEMSYICWGITITLLASQGYFIFAAIQTISAFLESSIFDRNE